MSKGSFTLDGTGLHINYDGTTLSVNTPTAASFPRHRDWLNLNECPVRNGQRPNTKSH
jgi:hypothetical protein